MVSRLCESCGASTEDTSTVWCSSCGKFIGFASPESLPEGPGLSVSPLYSLPAVVTAGEELRLPLAIRNSGTIVDQMIVKVPENFATWIRVDPAAVSLFPGESAECALVVGPPRSPDVRAGLHEVPVVVASVAAPDMQQEMGLVIDVQPFVEVNCELRPLKSSGTDRGLHTILLNNRENSDATILLSAEDAEQSLTFRFAPERAVVGPDERVGSELSVGLARSLTSEQPKLFPFTVFVETAGGSPPQRLAGTWQLEPPQQPLRLTLAEPTITALPGAELSTQAAVRNTGNRADHFRFEILGPAASWGRVIPESAGAPAGGEVRVAVSLLIPAPEALPSWLPWGVRVANLDGTRASVAEGTMSIEEVEVAVLTSIPECARGRWAGRYLLTVANRGSRTGSWRIVGMDDADELSFAFSHSTVTVEPGADALIAAKVRTRRPMLTGRPRSLEFGFALEVVAADSDQSRVLAVSQAALEQRAIMSIKSSAVVKSSSRVKEASAQKPVTPR
jgi:hypothetical protein